MRDEPCFFYMNTNVVSCWNLPSVDILLLQPCQGRERVPRLSMVWSAQASQTNVGRQRSNVLWRSYRLPSVRLLLKMTCTCTSIRSPYESCFVYSMATEDTFCKEGTSLRGRLHHQLNISTITTDIYVCNSIM